MLAMRLSTPLSHAAPPAFETDRQARLAALRARVRAIEEGAEGADAARAGGNWRRVLPLGVEGLDRHLPGGGLPLAGLHEIAGLRAEWDDGAATGFCLALLARLFAARERGPERGPVLWATRWRDLYAPGLAAFGVDPGRLILARAEGEADVLWAMEEGLRCAELAAVVGEVDALESSAGRRLQLAAEAGGMPAFVLRRRLRPARHAGGLSGAPSGALSRWRIAPARASGVVCPAGRPLTESAAARLPGRACWMVELLHCRGVGPGQWDLEWDDATGGFTLATALCDRPLASASPGAGRHSGVRLAG